MDHHPGADPLDCTVEIDPYICGLWFCFRWYCGLENAGLLLDSSQAIDFGRPVYGLRFVEKYRLILYIYRTNGEAKWMPPINSCSLLKAP